MISMAEKEELYTEYRKKVAGYVFGKLQNRHDAEDIVSEIFLKVYEKYSSYDGECASLSTWIYTVTRNTVIDYFRSNRSEEELPEDFSCGDLEEDEFLKKESLHELGRALAELDERSRALIIFRYYKEMTLKEIADRMGISYAYVKILHKSALHDLRTRISR